MFDSCISDTVVFHIESVWVRHSQSALRAGKGGFIALSTEPRFVAHRFWTIYNAMYYSEYVATRLDTWKDEGGELTLL